MHHVGSQNHPYQFWLASFQAIEWLQHLIQCISIGEVLVTQCCEFCKAQVQGSNFACMYGLIRHVHAALGACFAVLQCTELQWMYVYMGTVVREADFGLVARLWQYCLQCCCFVCVMLPDHHEDTSWRYNHVFVSCLRCITNRKSMPRHVEAGVCKLKL